MLNQYSEMMKQYQQEADKNAQHYKYIVELQHHKETKEAEVAQIQELQIIIQNLQNELNSLDIQKNQIIEDNKNNLKEIEEKGNKEINLVKTETSKTENNIYNLEQLIKNHEKEISSTNIQISRENKSQLEKEEQLNVITKESQNCLNKYNDLLSDLEDDPFNNQDFENFVSAMKEKGLTMNNLNEINKIKEDNESIKKRISYYKKLQNEGNEKIANLEKNIIDLEAKIKVQLTELDSITEQIQPIINVEKPIIKPTVPTMEFTPDQTKSIISGQNAILFRFDSITLNNDFIQNKKGLINLVFGFYTHETQSLNPIPISETKFNTPPICFTFKNDFQFKEYLERKVVSVTLINSNAMRAQEIAQGNMNLSSFLDYNDFTLTTKLYVNEEVIGTFDCSLKIFLPLSL